MKDKEIVYWKMRNGKSISVDLMDVNHLRNAFKHLTKGGKHQLKLLSFKKGYKSLTKDNYPNYEDLIDRWIIITQELITWINENYSA